MHDLLKLTSISNLLFILLLPESSRSDSPSGSSSGVFSLFLQVVMSPCVRNGWAGPSIFVASSVLRMCLYYRTSCCGIGAEINVIPCVL